MEKGRNFSKVTQVINCGPDEWSCRTIGLAWKTQPSLHHSSFILCEPWYQDYSIITLIIWRKTKIASPWTFIECPILCQLFSKNSVFIFSKPHVDQNMWAFYCHIADKENDQHLGYICRKQGVGIWKQVFQRPKPGHFLGYNRFEEVRAGILSWHCQHSKTWQRQETQSLTSISLPELQSHQHPGSQVKAPLEKWGNEVLLSPMTLLGWKRWL